jgi:uncharacterized protein with HEPN domain
MRRRDARAALTDALSAGTAIERHLGSTTLEQYRGDEILAGAVERRFEILGEALGRALRADPGLEARLPDVPDVIGFRNMLAHGYDVVSDETVYKNATEDLPVLLAKLRRLLDEEERP